MTWLTVIVLWTWTTLATFRAWTTLTLWPFHIVSRLLDEDTTRELELTRLLVDIDEFHINFITFLDASLFHGVKTFPVNLADMEQTILSRQELNEASIRHH